MCNAMFTKLNEAKPNLRNNSHCYCYMFFLCGYVGMVNELDLESSAEKLVGSSPSTRTII